MRWLKTLRPALPAAAAWCGLTILPQFLPAAAPTTPLKVRGVQSAQQPASAEALFPGATVVSDAAAAIVPQDGERPLAGAPIARLPGISTVSDARPAPVAMRPLVETLSDDSAGDYDIYPRNGVFHFSSGALRVRQPAAEPSAPVPSQQPLPSTSPTQATPAAYSSPFGEGPADLSNLSSVTSGSRSEVPQVSSAVDFALGGEQALVRATNDVGTLIQDATTVDNVSLFRRPMMSEPHIRGYHQRQIYTQLDGGYWIAARWDLDTIVSKIDSGVVEDVIIIKGPYSALYGPSLSFIDVVTARTPRSCCGLDIDARTVFNYDTNGQGWYGRQAFSGGAENYGFRISSGVRTANDYDAGDNVPIIGSYKSRDIDAAFGYDLDCNSRIEVKYVRLDVTDAELHNQPTNIDFLVTNGFTARFEMDYTDYFDHLVLEGWYNRTRVGQNSQNDSPLTVPPVFLDVDQYTDQYSDGARLGTTWGDFDCSHLTVGADYRHINQQILERSSLANVPAPPPFVFNGQFDLPLSDSYNPGIFAQATDHLNNSTKVTVGGRLDHVHTDPGVYVPLAGPSFTTSERDFDLWSAFVSAEYELNCEWTATAAFGHGQRAPTLTELYVNDTFIAGMQSGVNFYTGNPTLAEEKATQVDVGLIADYCNMRGSVRGFYTWVDDYITYVFNSFPAPNSIFGSFGFVNTNSATLAGFEVNGEYDLNQYLSVFGQSAYTEGRDQETDTPLYGIYPLQSRVGVRLENANQCRGWGAEFSSRIVDNQDRIAGPGSGPTTFTNTGVNGTYLASRGLLDEFPTPGFTTYDLRLFYRFSEAVLLTGGVENLTDKLYFEHFDYQIGLGNKNGTETTFNTPSFQRGRNFYLGMEARY